MFAGETQVSRTADVLAGDVIAGHISVHLLRAPLPASQPVPSFLAGLRAIGALPTPGADATSGRGITRTIVHAFAMRVTILAVKTLRALCFASYSSPFWLADAIPGSGVAFHGVFVDTVASLIASMSEEALFTTLLTQLAGETSRTRARAILRVTGRIVKALAFALAILAIGLVVARTIAQDTDPSIRAVAASVLSRAAGAVLAGALLRAVLPEGVRRAQLAAVLAAIPGRADASAVDRRALRVVLAVAAIQAILAECVEGTRPGARLAVPSRLAGTISGPRMTQLRVVVLALADLRTVGTVQIVLADSFVARFARPTWTAYTGAVSGIACSAVFTGAVARAVQAKRALGTDLQTFVVVITRFALALARNVMATAFVVAIAGPRAVVAPETLRASIRAD